MFWPCPTSPKSIMSWFWAWLFPQKPEFRARNLRKSSCFTWDFCTLPLDSRAAFSTRKRLVMWTSWRIPSSMRWAIKWMRRLWTRVIGNQPSNGSEVAMRRKNQRNTWIGTVPPAEVRHCPSALRFSHLQMADEAKKTMQTRRELVCLSVRKYFNIVEEFSHIYQSNKLML